MPVKVPDNTLIRMRSKYIQYILRAGLLAAVYYGAARLGLSLAIVCPQATPVWPPAGVALAVLMLYGRGLWPGIAAGAFLATLSTGAPPAVAGAVSLGNTLEALAGAYLLHRLPGFDNSLDRLTDVIGLALLAALCSMISATIGVTSLASAGLTPWPAYYLTWGTWWVGDYMGVLVVAPALLSWLTPQERQIKKQWLLEAFILLVSLVAITQAIGGGWLNAPHIIFPWVIWAAIRLGQRGLTLCVVAVVCLAAWNMAHTSGPFLSPRIHATLLELVTFTGVVSIVGMALAALLAERRRAEEQLQESAQKLRQLSTHLLTLQEKQRKSIAAELHDSISQTLSAAKFGLENYLQQGGGDADRLRSNTVTTSIQMLKRALDELRRISTALRPAMLDDLGVLATVGWFCREFQAIYSGIRVEQRIEVEETDVPDKLKIVIYRVLQEALNNAARHSSADRVTVALNRGAASLVLSIADNGRGFTPGQVQHTDDGTGGFGLISMRERVELSGGCFVLTAYEQQGTVITASWPLPVSA